MTKPGNQPVEKDKNIESIDVADYKPKPIPSKKWRGFAFALVLSYSFKIGIHRFTII